MRTIIAANGAIDFDAYAAYLATVREKLPAHVATFAADPRHYSLEDPETLHDAWLDTLTVAETRTGSQVEQRTTTVELRLLGAFGVAPAQQCLELGDAPRPTIGTMCYGIAASSATQSRGTW